MDDFTNSVKITILVENTGHGNNFLGEHGLSYWIETPEGPVMFDTGQGKVLLGNAERHGVDLSTAQAIVLSHGHDDHVNGLVQVLPLTGNIPVYLHPAALERKFCHGPGPQVRDISHPFLSENQILETEVQVCYTAEPTEIVKGLWVTGQVPRTNDYEDVGGPFFLDANAQVPDPVLDDQSLFFESSKGIVLILGCAHAGVVNTMDYVASLTGTNKIHAVIGGMHLVSASAQRMENTLAVFRKYRVDRLSPCHCTGIRAVAAFWNTFPDNCLEAHAGKEFVFKLP